MTAHSEHGGHGEQFWDDVRRITEIGAKARAYDGMHGDTMRIILLCMVAGKVSDAAIQYRAGRVTRVEVAKAIYDYIMAGLVTLTDWVPDAREFLEIEARQTVVILEHEEF